MDTSRQLYAEAATGWQRGLYDDIRATFRAPVVNWIWRTLTANEPEFTRYLWGQVKPVFGTAALGEFTVEFRDAVLAAVEADNDLPAYRRADVGVPPAEYAELRGQLATFDVVIPRLAVFFEIVDRSLGGERVGGDPSGRAATAPLPDRLDRDRGRPPTLAAFDAAPPEAADAVDGVYDFHGFEDGLPSIYRCLLQWPGAFATAWDDLEPVLRSPSFDRAVERSQDLTTAYVDDLAHSPRLTPEELRSHGFDADTVEELAALFAEFNRGSIERVLPAVPVLADAFDVAGERG
ncbi:MAG: halocarboxylic acid dehydrogenase DehI family protein [Haloferacaceae archaeon]